MSGALYNLAAMTVGSTGTGTITLGSAATINGVLYLSFAGAGVPNGATVYYSINDVGQSEVGYGTYTSSGTTLTRTVTNSTNSNTAINMTAAAIVRISFPTSQSREVLIAARTYYVLTTGSDSNTGLANTSAGAFLTLQKAIDTVAMLDTSIYNVTIQMGAGTYTGSNTLKTLVGAGQVTILGDATTPANVVISVTGNNCFYADNIVGRWYLKGLKLTTVTSGYQIYATGPAVSVDYENMDFGASPVIQVLSYNGAFVRMNGTNNITGGALFHWYIGASAQFQTIGTVSYTITGTPAFTTFAYTEALGLINAPSFTFSGTATGQRYNAIGNGVIYQTGAVAAYFPGNSAGATASGGQYL